MRCFFSPKVSEIMRFFAFTLLLIQIKIPRKNLSFALAGRYSERHYLCNDSVLLAFCLSCLVKGSLLVLNLKSSVVTSVKWCHRITSLSSVMISLNESIGHTYVFVDICKYFAKDAFKFWIVALQSNIMNHNCNQLNFFRHRLHFSKTFLGRPVSNRPEPE